MKKFLYIVIALVILAIAGYGIAYIAIPVTSVELNEYTHTIDMVCDDAYIVRDETVYYATSDGLVYNIVTDGDRVSENLAIATIYNGDVSYDILKQLRTIDSKINTLKTKSSGDELYKTAQTATENEIALRLDDVIELTRDNDVSEIHDIHRYINGLRGGTPETVSSRINALQISRINVESNISAAKKDTIADRAGIFSSYIDGLESVLTPERIKEYTPEYIRSLTSNDNNYTNGTQVITGDPICKVMNNHNWYVLGIANEAQAEKLKASPNVKVRFTNLSGSEVKATLVSQTEPDENGECLFLLRVQTYLESAFSYRNIDVQIVFDEFTGYKVPTDAIHTGDAINKYYVTARKGSAHFPCDVEIMYTDMDEGYSIIESTPDAQNNLSVMDRLVVGER